MCAPARDVGIEKGEGPAADVFGRPREVRFLTDEQEHLEDISGYAVYVVARKDNLRIPKPRKFWQIILVAPYRHDFRQVYAQGDTLRLEVFCHIGSHAAQVPEHRTLSLANPVPDSKFDASRSAATGPPRSGRPIDYDPGEVAAARTVKLANAVRDKLKQYKECLQADTKLAQELSAPQAGEPLHAVPPQTQNHAILSTRDPIDAGSAMKHVIPAPGGIGVCRQRIVTGRMSEHSQKDEHKRTLERAIQVPARHSVLANLPALVCHVARAFRAMAFNRLNRTVSKKRLLLPLVRGSPSMSGMKLSAMDLLTPSWRTTLKSP